MDFVLYSVGISWKVWKMIILVHFDRKQVWSAFWMLDTELSIAQSFSHTNTD